MQTAVRYPRYRFAVLAVFMLISIAIEIQWLTHAAVARPAEVFYSGQFRPGSYFNIDFLAMLYMLAFLLVSFPASYVIDTYGIRIGLGTGALLLCLFSLLKALMARSFAGMIFAQTGLAVAQPFIINGITALTVRWFPLRERALAAGFSILAQLIGIVIAMMVTPLLIGTDPASPGYGTGFEKMLWIYAIVCIAASLLFLVVLREKPDGIPIDTEQIVPFRTGVKLILKNRDMQITMVLFLIGLGIFNAVSSMTDSLTERLGVKDSDGLIGGLMLIGGIVGAIIVPALSDHFRKRKVFLVLCLAGMIPGVAGLTFAPLLSDQPEQVYTIALIASFILGFFVLSAGPVGFQYAAEISSPAPESASQGILLWVGQLTGMIFVAGMSIRNNQFMGHTLVILFLLSLVSFLAVLFLKESPLMAKK